MMRRLLFLLNTVLAYAQNITRTTNTTTTIVTQSVPPILSILRSLPYPLNITYEQSGLIIPWVLCVIITAILTVCCCICRCVRQRKKSTMRIVVEPRGNAKEVDV
jgi:predicted signal transduction protein with EAL and GGDEF domain